MASRLPALLVAVLLVSAGCAATDGPTPAPVTQPSTAVATPAAEPAPEPGGSPTPTRPPAPSPTPPSTPTPRPDPTERLPVPPGVVPLWPIGVEPPVSPETDVYAFATSEDVPSVTAWYRNQSSWTERYAVLDYNPAWGWMNRLAFTRGDETLYVFVATREVGTDDQHTELTVARGTGVVGYAHTVVDPALGYGPVNYTVPMVPLERVDEVVGLGNFNPPDHTFPTDHSYQFVPDDARPAPVVAPADGMVTAVSYRRVDEPPHDDYSVVIDHTNTFTTEIVHLASVAPALAEAAGGFEPGTTRVRVPVSAGDPIGTGPSEGSAAVDWWTTDLDRRQTGFVHPEYYGGAVHAVSFYEYLTPELRAAYRPLLTRTAEPRIGQFAYDQPGRLVGNWFLETEPLATDVWEQHLAFAYSIHDPADLRVGVGGVVLPAERYAVVGNAPDPATVTAGSGPVVYHLRPVTGTGYTRDGPTRTLLVQVLDGERLRVQGFEGQVEDPTFTAEAVTYFR